MVVMILETVPVSAAGELTRWLIEPHPGVLCRPRLGAWCATGCGTSAARAAEAAACVQLWSTNNEQRFQMRSRGQDAAGDCRLRGAAVDPRPAQPRFSWKGIPHRRGGEPPRARQAAITIRIPHRRGGEPSSVTAACADATYSPHAWG